MIFRLVSASISSRGAGTLKLPRFSGHLQCVDRDSEQEVSDAKETRTDGVHRGVPPRGGAAAGNTAQRARANRAGLRRASGDVTQLVAARATRPRSADRAPGAVHLARGGEPPA